MAMKQRTAQMRPVLAAVALVLGVVGCRRPNHAPAVAGPPAGVGVAIQDTNYQFTVSASDEDGDSVCCRVDWGDGDTSAWCSFVLSDSVVSFAHAWDTAGLFATRAQARDARGGVSEWSAPAVVAVRDSHPELWHFDNSQGLRTPLVLNEGTEDIIYSCEDGDRVYALNGDGTVRHVARSVDTIEGGAFSTSPAYCAATRHIIVGNDEGELYAFTRELELAWHWPGNTSGRTFDRRDWGTPVVEGNSIYAVREDRSSWQRYVCCFLDLGEQVALVGLDSLYPEDETDQPPAIDSDGNVILASFEGYVYKFAPRIDRLLWRTFVSEDILTGPVVGSDGMIYCSAYMGEYLYAIEPCGSVRWNTRVETPGWPAIGESLLFTGSDLPAVFALSLDDGDVVWSTQFEGGLSPLATPLVLSNGVVCFSDDCYDVICGVRQSDGALLWTTSCKPDSWPGRARDLEEVSAAPSLCQNGDVLVPTSRGLSRVQGHAGTTLGATPWPKWQHDLHNSGWVGQP
jgi:outer membrane protein assembly factor BamB